MDQISQITCAATKTFKKSCWGIFISVRVGLLSKMDSVMITVTLSIM